jgi:hypothetical protein
MNDLAVQARCLEPLRRMCELDSYDAELNVATGGTLVPLVVRRNGSSVFVGTYHGLLSDQSLTFDHPLNALRGSTDAAVILENEFRLTRNLPGAYGNLRRILGE